MVFALKANGMGIWTALLQWLGSKRIIQVDCVISVGILVYYVVSVGMQEDHCPVTGQIAFCPGGIGVRA